MQYLKLFLDEFMGLLPFLILWQGLIIGLNQVLDYLKRNPSFSWKKGLLLNFIFSIICMLAISLCYFILVVKPLLHSETRTSFLVLSVLSSIFLYQVKRYLYSKFDSLPRQPKLVSSLSVGVILLPGIIYLIIALMIGEGRG